MAYSNMSVTRHTMLEDVKCSMCGGQKMHYRFMDEIDGVLDFSRALEVSHSVWRITKAFYLMRGISASREESIGMI